MDSEKQNERMLTLAEACRLLNVHIGTLRRWSDQGRVPSYRVGRNRSRRFREEDISALLVDAGPERR